MLRLYGPLGYHRACDRVYIRPSENREADMIDWLTNWLSRAGAVVASWFASQDSPNFDFFAGLMSVLLLAVIVLTTVFSKSLLDYWRSRR